MYKVLVIDDDFANRKDTYQKIFTNEWNDIEETQIEIVKNFSGNFILEKYDPKMDDNINEKSKEELLSYDVIFIDYNLIGNQENSDISNIELKLANVLYSIKDKRGALPVVFFVSDNWSTKSIDVINEIRINHSLDDFAFNIYTFSSLKDIVRYSELSQEYVNIQKKVEKFRKKVSNQIDKKHNISSYSLRNKQELNILVFSDLQFGSKYQTISSSIKNSILREKDVNEKIDFLVICGDVAENGLEEEYSAALEFFNEEFLKKCLGELDFRKRIIIVPGNHDYDLRYTLINNLKLDKDSFDGRKLNIENICEQLKCIGTSNNSPNMQGFSNFVKFASLLTEDDSWYMDNTRYYRVYNQFKNLGIRFIGINTVSHINALETNKAYVDDEIVNRLCANYHDGLYNILVGHHSNIEHNKTKILDYSSIISPLNVKLVLAGHTHKFGVENYNKDKLSFSSVEAPTLKLSHTNADTGFAIVTLKCDDKNDILEGIAQQYILDMKNNNNIIKGEQITINTK